MRGIKKFVPALVVFLLLTACAKTDVAEIEQTDAITSATKETEAADTEMVTDQNIGADGNILVAYFSRAGENYNVGVVEKGNTEIVAEMIAQETGADLFRIQPTYDYPETYEECTEAAKKEQEEKARPELSDTVDNISEYDVIYVGYPIWWGDMPMAVYTFLESYDFSGKTIVPFCSHGGGRFGQSLTAIAKLAPDADMGEGLAINYSGGTSMHGDVTEWLKQNGIETK